jgi:ribonuclease-3
MSYWWRVFRLTSCVPIRLRFYRRAFTHKSALEQPNARPSDANERQEFLGDAVLALLAAEYLYRHYPQAEEGFLTRERAVWVSRPVLNQTAKRMGLQAMLRANMAPEQMEQSNVPGNALEALVGAIYLDRGLHGARLFFERRLLRALPSPEELSARHTNFKGHLMEYAQSKGWEIVYQLAETGSDIHKPPFTMHLYINGTLYATAKGSSKKEAAQEAARQALNSLGIGWQGE